MNVLIAPDKFKGTLTAAQVCDAVAEGLQQSGREFAIRKMPLADGGDGTLDFFLHHLGGERIALRVHDPLFREVTAEYVWLPESKTAFVEMARASGLSLLTARERNPLLTSTVGTGELIRDAGNRGAKKILIGIGGSATNDGAAGVLHALGAQLLTAHGERVTPTGGELNRIARVEWPERAQWKRFVSVTAFCDVQNPFFGLEGAAYVYAPQKGATPDQLPVLDAGLRAWAALTLAATGVDVQLVAGAGAGGGMAGGLHAWLGAELKPGIDVILDLAQFDEAARWADVIITGEGKLDEQTLRGKVVAGVINRATNKTVLAVCGRSELSSPPIPVFSLEAFVGVDRALRESFAALRDLCATEVAAKI
jgi:glycerate kinase